MTTSSGTVCSGVDYDPLIVNDDPYPIYKTLRDSSPLYRNETRGFWALTRFNDVQQASRDWQTFSQRPAVDLDETGRLFQPGNFVDSDPPEHDRLREAVRERFDPKTIVALEPAVRQRVRSLIGTFIENGQADLVQDFARLLPTHLVCDLLGFPEADHEQLWSWFINMAERELGTAELPARAWEARVAAGDYIGEALRLRADSPQDDLLTTIIGAERVGMLSHEEAVNIPILLLFAGIQTTWSLISTALIALDQHRDQRTELTARPELIPNAIEEFLRFDAPVQFLARSTTRDVKLHGQVVPRGGRVLLIWGAANRDGRRWENPDVLDVRRDLHRHLAFGDGIHHCLGAPLARLEARVALEEVLAHLPEYEVSGTPTRVYTPADRAFRRIPVVFTPRSRPH